MTVPRVGHCSFAIEGRVYVVGGMDGKATHCLSVQLLRIFHVATLMQFQSNYVCMSRPYRNFERGLDKWL